MNLMRWDRAGRPVWLESRAQSRPSYPVLRGSRDVEVAIIGGGMTGAIVATVFASAGVNVAVLEASHIGLGSTAASTALLLREPDLGLQELGRRYGAKAARHIWERSAAATDEFAKTLRRLRIACDLEDRDSIFYTLRRDAASRLRAEYHRRRRAGLQAEWLTPASIEQATSIDAPGAIRSRRNAQFDPYRACSGLMRAAADAGASIFERSPVTRIRTLRDGIEAMTSRGLVRASELVVATGYSAPAWQPPVGRFQLHRTYVLATPPLSKAQRATLGLDDVMLWDTERPYHYMRWTKNRRLLLGGGDRPLAPRRTRAFTQATGELYRYYRSLFPILDNIGIERAWDGVFATTPDGLPYIGRHSRHPRRLFALGYGGNGMTFGFLAAQMLLEHWQGIPSPDHDLFGFGRFRA
jgi:glycine/D-amino acid oxidase-like deaminating enzyme